jgi:aminoglycoside phosphotransferase (APT) family kinase protein
MVAAVEAEPEFDRASSPSLAGLDRFAHAVGAKIRPRTLRRLRGGLGASTHVLAIDDERLVLKRYPVGAMVEREWHAMNVAYRHGLPTPRPVAFDPDGEWFGHPALAMTLLQGRPTLEPTDRDGYARQVADVLATMHDLPLASLPDMLRGPHGIDTLDLTTIPAEGHLTPAIVDRIKRCLDGHLPAMTTESRVFNHGDFHPGNLVWHKNTLAGVVDWSNSRPGPRWSELAYFRVELSVLVDVQIANRVLATYESLAGQRSPMQPAWDLLHVLSGHTWMHSWLAAYREQGRPDLDVPSGRARLRRLAYSLLNKLET